jgi:hypothetical protein
MRLIPAPVFCPTCGRAGRPADIETETEGRPVVHGSAHPVLYVPLRRTAGDGSGVHTHSPREAYFIMSCAAGYSFMARQSYCVPCWCGWPETPTPGCA